MLAGEVVNPAVGSSVLYWAGHGWSDGARAALAHAGSPALVGGSGVDPQQLAQAIRVRQTAAAGGAGGAGGWALVVVEAGHAAEVADAVMAALHGPGAPGRLLLVAVPGDGAAPPGGLPACWRPCWPAPSWLTAGFCCGIWLPSWNGCSARVACINGGLVRPR